MNNIKEKAPNNENIWKFSKCRRRRSACRHTTEFIFRTTKRTQQQNTHREQQTELLRFFCELLRRDMLAVCKHLMNGVDFARFPLTLSSLSLTVLCRSVVNHVCVGVCVCVGHGAQWGRAIVCQLNLFFLFLVIRRPCCFSSVLSIAARFT